MSIKIMSQVCGLPFRQNNIKINSLPLKRGIYFLCCGMEIVYVGQSTNIIQRIISHILSNKKFDSFNFVEFLDEDLNDIEAEHIMAIQPKYNYSIPTNKIWLTPKQIRRKYRLNNKMLSKLIIRGEIECKIFYGLPYYKEIR